MKRLLSTWLGLTVLFVVLTRAFKDPSQVENPETDNLPGYQDRSNDSNAISYLRSKTTQRDAIYSEAVQLLESMTTSPSCTRIAATRLVTSCQSFGGKTRSEEEPPEALDCIRSVYAARLAICELKGAGASIPAPCLPVTISPPSSKSRFGFMSKSNILGTGTDLVPKELLEQCLKALESRPQWWTSYSNSRQNAIVICQAARIEIEKEELLDLHRSVLRSSVKLDQGIHQALHNAAMEASKHDTFLQAVQLLQRKLVTDIEASQSLFQQTLGGFLRDIELGIERVAAVFASALGHVQSETAVLGKGIRNASSQVDMLQQALQLAHEEALSKNRLALRTHDDNILAYRELASVLQLSLESLVETDMARLSQSIGRLDAALEWLTSRLVLILEQENKMAERLQTMETTMEQSQMRANELQNAQNMQVQALSAQSQIQKEMQLNSQVSQALLDKTTATAFNLHALIEETATKYKQIPRLHLGGLSTWTFCGTFLILIGTHNVKAAVSLFFLVLGHLMVASFLRFF
ncbi:uncharacterized protein N7443_008726 [Penicillium atrosanguineum]|uniref:uncharacterized protein n=1 Tax=Penicillium atrosanguineum TaxID=1132637 RepID=UPI00239EBCC8|nr:uncharacterized protein N7443_008726 [Penicillium atrosanguineum]KAJ5292773.1 hypothetical protein N7443_008726 [Penicillium atrosanguineum]